jgi:hypothetical protein
LKTIFTIGLRTAAAAQDVINQLDQGAMETPAAAKGCAHSTRQGPR